MAVNDVDMTVEDGQIFGLIGPNGAGKTTLFNLIAGFYKPNTGHIRFQEHDITGLKPYDICKLGIGRTFQTTKPFMESSVTDNVIAGALLKDSSVSKARKIANDIIELLELDRLADSFGHELTVPDRKRL